MLKLKYLFENFSLAKMLVQNYTHDDLKYFKYFRISSNAIYPFEYLEQVNYLRLTPEEAVDSEAYNAEIELLEYLKDVDYPCVRILKTKEKELWAKKITPFGNYYMTALKKVPGVCVETLEMSDLIASQIGDSLGKLHKITKKISFDFPIYKDIIKTMMNYFRESSKTDYERCLWLYDLSDRFDAPYGFVHYDFELDNLFLENDQIYPIDFNDGMIHFLEMDIINALEDIDKEFHEAFLEGYIQHMSYQVDSDLTQYCVSFRQIYKKYRILLAIEESWEHEPSWMVALRSKLSLLVENL